MSVAHEKKLAAEAAAQLVEDGMIVGLGTGSTVAYLLPALAVRGLDLRCVATSPATEHLARDLACRARVPRTARERRPDELGLARPDTRARTSPTPRAVPVTLQRQWSPGDGAGRLVRSTAGLPTRVRSRPRRRRDEIHCRIRRGPGNAARAPAASPSEDISSEATR